MAFRKGLVTVRKLLGSVKSELGMEIWMFFYESEKDIKGSPLVINPQLIVIKGKVAFRKGPVTIKKGTCD